jgi:hypothetical protein
LVSEKPPRGPYGLPQPERKANAQTRLTRAARNWGKHILAPFPRLGGKLKKRELFTPSVNPPRKNACRSGSRLVTYDKSFLHAFTREKRYPTWVNFSFLGSPQQALRNRIWVPSLHEHQFGGPLPDLGSGSSLRWPDLTRMLAGAPGRREFVERPKHLGEHEDCASCRYLSGLVWMPTSTFTPRSNGTIRKHGVVMFCFCVDAILFPISLFGRAHGAARGRIVKEIARKKSRMRKSE